MNRFAILSALTTLAALTWAGTLLESWWQRRDSEDPQLDFRWLLTLVVGGAITNTFAILIIIMLVQEELRRQEEQAM